MTIDCHIQRRLAAVAASVPRSAGALVREVAERCGASEDQVRDIALAVTEAAANAVIAYPSDAAGVFEIETDLAAGEFVIRVRDYAPSALRNPHRKRPASAYSSCRKSRTAA